MASAAILLVGAGGSSSPVATWAYQGADTKCVRPCSGVSRRRRHRLRGHRSSPGQSLRGGNRGSRFLSDDIVRSGRRCRALGRTYCRNSRKYCGLGLGYTYTGLALLPILVRAGTVSYSLYLWHPLVLFVFWSRISGDRELVTLGAMRSLDCAGDTLSWVTLKLLF